MSAARQLLRAIPILPIVHRADGGVRAGVTTAVIPVILIRTIGACDTLRTKCGKIKACVQTSRGVRVTHPITVCAGVEGVAHGTHVKSVVCLLLQTAYNYRLGPCRYFCAGASCEARGPVFYHVRDI